MRVRSLALVCAGYALVACGGALGGERADGGGSSDSAPNVDGNVSENDTGAVDGGGNDGPSLPSCGDAGGASLGSFGPQDPDFSSAGVWTYHGGASDGPGDGGTNHAILPNGSSSISQTFPMPESTAWCGNGLSLHVATSSPCGNGSLIFNGGLAVYSTLPTTSGSPDVCLGDWAYGDAKGETTLAITGGPNMGEILCTSVDIDQLKLGDTAACARPGQVLGGSFTNPGIWSATGTAEVARHGGTGGGPRGHLWTKGRCDMASLSTSFSVPYASHLSNAALALTVSGTAGATLTVSGGVAPYVTVVTTGAPQTVHACLQSYLRGRYWPLTLGLSGELGDCLAAQTQDVFVDELSLVSDPSCSGPEDIVDGDFESPAQAGAWNLSTIEAGTGLAIETGHAHSGSYALHMSASKVCATGMATAAIGIPATTGTGPGPALHFWYDIRSLGAARFGVQEQSRGGGPYSLKVTTGWQEATVCLPPGRLPEGDALVVAIESSGSCGGPDSGDGWFDDFTVTTDPSCPSK